MDPDETPPAESTPPNPETPPTTPPATSPTDDAAARQLEILNEVLREQAATQRRLQEENERLRAQASQPATPTQAPPRDVAAERDRFYTDPIGVLEEREAQRDAKIAKMLQDTIAPLTQFTSGFTRTSAYDQLKARYLADPTYGEHLRDPKVMAAVDAIMARSEPTETIMTGAITQVVGLKTFGKLDAELVRAGIVVPTATPAAPPTPPVTPPVPPVPAHIPPSPPPPPRQQSTNQQAPQLTELEKRLARERGMTEVQYLAWRDSRADEIISVNIDKDGRK